MRTKDQGTLDAILKFVNKYYQKNRVAPTITDVAEGVGVARSTTHRYLQELSERGVLNYDRGILSAPESAKMKTAYVSAPLVGSIQCGSPEEEQEYVEEYVSLPVSMFGKGEFYILRAKGDSMVDAGIEEDDLLVIERNCPADVSLPMRRYAKLKTVCSVSRRISRTGRGSRIRTTISAPLFRMTWSFRERNPKSFLTI